MDPVVAGALITAAVSLVSTLVLLHSNRQMATDNRVAQANTNAMEGVKETVDSWRELNQAKDQEIARLRAEVDRLRRVKEEPG